jgi:hypothetical protein
MRIAGVTKKQELMSDAENRKVMMNKSHQILYLISFNQTGCQLQKVG